MLASAEPIFENRSFAIFKQFLWVLLLSFLTLLTLGGCGSSPTAQTVVELPTSPPVVGVVEDGVIHLSNDLAPRYAGQLGIRLQSVEGNPPLSLDIQNSHFVAFQQGSSILYVADLSSAFKGALEPFRSIPLPGVQRAQAEIIDFHSLQSNRIYQGNPQKITLKDVALVLGLSQLGSDPSAAAIATQASQILGEPISANNLNPIPNLNNSDYTQPQGSIDLKDVALLLAAFYLNDNEINTPSLSVGANTLLGSEAIQEEDILRVPMVGPKLFFDTPLIDRLSGRVSFSIFGESLVHKILIQSSTYILWKQGNGYTQYVADSSSAFKPLTGLTGIFFPGGEASTCIIAHNIDSDPTDLANRLAATTACTPPNIVLILTDDQRWDTLDYMPVVKRELQGKGLTFTNSFVSSSICCPSRATLLSGLLAHQHGVYTNVPPRGGFPKFQDNSTVATWLQNAGYRTGLIGKYLNGYYGSYTPPGWDEWQAFRKIAYYDYTLTENGTQKAYSNTNPIYYSTDLLARRAVQFIRSTPSTQPFFLYFAPAAPHYPSIPAPRHQGTYRSLSAWRPPNFNEEDVSDKPSWTRKTPLPDLANIDTKRINQLESLLAVDDAIQSIIDELINRHELSNTVFIFTSDNGNTWGEHRYVGKMVPYEESIRVPLVIRYDAMLNANATSTPDLVYNLDLAPTIADLAQTTVPSTMGGISLVPALHGSTLPTRDLELELYANITVKPPGYRGLRTPLYTYVHYITNEEELYDLAQDPYQLENKVTDPAYSGILQDLRTRVQNIPIPSEAASLWASPPPDLLVDPEE